MRNYICDFSFVCGKLDHVERDCPSFFTNEFGVVHGKRQFEPSPKADGLKGVSLKEFNSCIHFNKQQMMHRKEGFLKGRMEVEYGEALAI